MSSDKKSKKAISVKDIVVQQYRIKIKVECEPTLKFSTPEIAMALVAKIPSLAKHKCKNSNKKTFKEELKTTSLPHVLEHMIIDYQVGHPNTSKDDFAFMGTTSWIDAENNTAIVEVNYKDDFVALEAIKQSEILLNEIVMQQN